MKSVPVLRKDRIVTIDIIRGFALFGIFLANMPAFHSPVFMMEVYGHEQKYIGVDFWLDLFFALFIDMKFFTIFSFLFGLGFFIFMSRAEQKGSKVNRLYLRRVLALMLFGLVHLVFLWFGDILHTYALTGILLIFFYKRKIKTILIWAFSLLFLFHALLSALLLVPEDALKEIERSTSELHSGKLASYIDVYEHAGYVEWVSYRIQTELVAVLQNVPFALIPVLALFLFGLAAGKAGIFQPNTKYIELIRKICFSSLIISIPLVSILALYKLEFFHAGIKNNIIIQLFTSLSGVTLCFFYISLLTLLLRKEKWQSRMRLLGYVGQMALTNYLLQTVICITLFVGLGLYRDVSLLIGTLIAIFIFAVQVLYSYLWFQRFQFGPLEWLWRTFTYGRLQIMEQRKLNNRSNKKDFL